ncbi:conserved hypothetical protein [Candidatus Magnetomoraceae bacterium gMMP-15]
MKRRYQLSRNDEENKLLITEFIEWDGKYEIMNKEEYDQAIIEEAVSKGTSELISILRTPNMYPFASVASSIAKSVVSLYSSSISEYTELLVDADDLEKFQKPVEEDFEEEVKELSDLSDDLVGDEIDDGFLESNELESIVPSSKPTITEDEDNKED